MDGAGPGTLRRASTGEATLRIPLPIAYNIIYNSSYEIDSHKGGTSVSVVHGLVCASQTSVHGHVPPHILQGRPPLVLAQYTFPMALLPRTHPQYLRVMTGLSARGRVGGVRRPCPAHPHPSLPTSLPEQGKGGTPY